MPVQTIITWCFSLRIVNEGDLKTTCKWNNPKGIGWGFQEV